MTCGFCRDCKYWTPPQRTDDEGYGPCGISKNPHTREDTRKIRPMSDPYYSLESQPDFGCVQFEAKT